jgi:hypothetical protein
MEQAPIGRGLFPIGTESAFMMANTNLPDFAQDLARIHRVLTRGIAVSADKGAEFARGGFPDTRTRQGYLDYVQSLATVLQAHHLGEDEIAFPFFRERLPSPLYNRLSADHKKFEALVTSLRQATTAVAADRSQAGLDQLAGDLRILGAIWTPHMSLEEGHFSAEALAAAMTPEEQGRLSEAMARHGVDHSTPGYLAVPFILFNLHAEDRAAMAATLPSMVVNELVPTVWKDQWAPMKPFLLD